MAGVFLLRMALGIAFSLLIYHFLPIPLRYRQVLAIIVFSPIFECCADLYGTLRL